MKTKSEVIKENPEYKKLINAVVNSLNGIEQIEDLIPAHKLKEFDALVVKAEGK